LTWVGFQADADGASRLFAQFCGEVSYEQTADGRNLHIDIAHARYGSRNSRRPLDTRFFSTSIARVNMRRRSHSGRGAHRRPPGIRITLTFKDDNDTAAGQARVVNEADGYTYLYLDVAPGPAASELPNKKAVATDG